jgi:hypothetical protein
MQALPKDLLRKQSLSWTESGMYSQRFPLREKKPAGVQTVHRWIFVDLALIRECQAKAGANVHWVSETIDVYCNCMELIEHGVNMCYWAAIADGYEQKLRLFSLTGKVSR